MAEASECPEEAQDKLRGQLQSLGLSGEGDPCHWKGIDCLECIPISIWSSAATGDLSFVKEMTDLGVLELAGSRVTGNVSELAMLKELTYLSLEQTKVVGNVAELSELTDLRYLRLSQTQVVGDLAELSKLTALHELCLSHTQVSGNVAGLSKLNKLTLLDLSQTQVVGDVSWLWDVTKLKELRFSQTSLHGHFGIISRMPDLLKADFSGTAVSGDLVELEPGCCQELRELHLGVPASILCSSVSYCFSTCLWKSVVTQFETFFFACEDTQLRISYSRVLLPALQSLNASTLDSEFAMSA